MWFSNPLKKYSKELSALYAKKQRLDDEMDVKATPGSELYMLIKQIDELIEGDYSHAVFDFYSPQRPMLICVDTQEETTWLDAFSDDFEKTTPGQRHSLVGLIEGEGMYRFK